jgi:hypothetical protein
MGDNAASDNEKKERFCKKKNFLTVLNIVWTRSLYRNRNLNFSQVGTGTAIIHYGFTTLDSRQVRFII